VRRTPQKKSADNETLRENLAVMEENLEKEHAKAKMTDNEALAVRRTNSKKNAQSQKSSRRNWP